jgi:hypothetical protein
MKKTLALGCQVVGLTSALYGVFLLVGIPWTFLVAGLVIAGVGTLLEAGRL